MLHRLALAAAFSLAALSMPAKAQAPQVVPACGAASIPVGPGGRLFVDQAGNLCTTGGSGGGSSSTGSVTPAGTNGTQAQAVQGINGGVPQNVNAGTDGSTTRAIRTTTTGALEPPTAASGKVVESSVTLTANTSTQILAANASRIALEIQCDGTAVVGISRTGGTLTSATAAPLVIPAGSYPLYTMPIATLTAVTAYTGTGQVCRVTEYLR